MVVGLEGKKAPRRCFSCNFLAGSKVTWGRAARHTETLGKSITTFPTGLGLNRLFEIVPEYCFI